MNPIMIDLGFIQIYWYSFFIFAAIVVATLLILKEAKRFDVSENFIINLALYTIPVSLIGARIYYVIFNWSYYSNNLLSIIKVWEGGLAIHGGIIAGLLFIVYYTKKQKQPTLKTLDFIVVGLIIGQAIGRWGNFFNQEAHGPITTLSFLQSLHLPQFIINGMKIGVSYYHPTFLYESVGCLIGFVILLIIRRAKNIKVGQLTAFYLIWYGAIRFMIESLRTDSLMLGSLKVAQLVSIFMILIGLVIMIFQAKGSKFEKRYNLDVK